MYTRQYKFHNTVTFRCTASWFSFDILNTAVKHNCVFSLYASQALYKPGKSNFRVNSTFLCSPYGDHLIYPPSPSLPFYLLRGKRLAKIRIYVCLSRMIKLWELFTFLLHLSSESLPALNRVSWLSLKSLSFRTID